MESVNVRNLEQIQEQEAAPRASRLATLLLAGLAGAALVTAGVVMSKRTGPPARSTQDPLAELVKSVKTDSKPAEQLDGRDVTFPGILSDAEKPTTALAAVKDERGRLVTQPTADALAEPPPATDRLPVVPLPIGTLLQATPVTTSPKDSLTSLAASASGVQDGSEMVAAGMDGGFQLQVASFKDATDADRLVDDLRKRGHRAFRQAAYVPERGLWHRVRIGPFKSRYEANQYRSKFEKVERVSPFVVDPDKVKQAEDQRALRMTARAKRTRRADVGTNPE
jgi:cell division septation protein DedD